MPKKSQFGLAHPEFHHARIEHAAPGRRKEFSLSTIQPTARLGSVVKLNPTDSSRPRCAANRVEHAACVYSNCRRPTASNRATFSAHPFWTRFCFRGVNLRYLSRSGNRIVDDRERSNDASSTRTRFSLLPPPLQFHLPDLRPPLRTNRFAIQQLPHLGNHFPRRRHPGSTNTP